MKHNIDKDGLKFWLKLTIDNPNPILMGKQWECLLEIY